MQKINLAYVIDDDEILVMLVKIQMKKNEAYDVVESFDNGEEALLSLKTLLETGGQLPEMILLDLNMPIMDGWQFLEAYEQLHFPHEIPVFIATSSIDPRDIEKAKAHPNVKDYIKKPITQDTLNAIASKLGKG